LKETLSNKHIIFKGQLFEDKPYTRYRFSGWARKYPDNKEIMNTIKKIDEILEGRIIVGAMNKKLHPTPVIFNLKNNYGWKDEQHFKHSGLSSLLKTINDEKESPISKETGQQADIGDSEEKSEEQKVEDQQSILD
jgi:hypothetical protein